MTYINPFVYSNHIPTMDGFLNGDLPVRVSSFYDTSFDQFTPDEAMTWVRRFNACVALEKTQNEKFKPYEQMNRLFPVVEIDDQQGVDIEDYDNFLWNLSKVKLEKMQNKKTPVSLHSILPNQAQDVTLARVENIDGQQFIEASVDLKKWAGSLTVGERNFVLEYAFDEHSVSQRSLRVSTSTESLARYLKLPQETNPGILLYEAAKNFSETLFPRTLKLTGGQTFRKLFQISDVHYVKREDEGMIDNDPDLVARAEVRLSSSEIHDFAEAEVVQVNLREWPTNGSYSNGQDEVLTVQTNGKAYFVEVILKRPQSEQFGPKLSLQGRLRDWLIALWTDADFKTDELSIEDVLTSGRGERVRLTSQKPEREGLLTDSEQKKLWIEEIMKQAG